MIGIADDASQDLMTPVWWILYTAPIGVFGLAAPVTAKLGWDLIVSLGVFIVSVFAGLLILMIVLFVPLWFFVARIGPVRFLSGTFGAVSIALSSTSTAAGIGAAILATFLVSLTVAPVPSSVVVTMAPALETIGVPVAGLAILLGIDRIPDMMRSAVNVLGQISTAVFVDRWTGGSSRHS